MLIKKSWISMDNKIKPHTTYDQVGNTFILAINNSKYSCFMLKFKTIKQKLWLT